MRCSPSLTRWVWNPKNHLASLAPERRRYGKREDLRNTIEDFIAALAPEKQTGGAEPS